MNGSVVSSSSNFLNPYASYTSVINQDLNWQPSTLLQSKERKQNYHYQQKRNAS